MGFWQSIKRAFSSEPQEKADKWAGQGFDFTNWKNSNFWGSHNGALRTDEEIFGVISRLANTISSLPIHEYNNFKEVNTPLTDLLTTEANPSMSAYSLLNQLEVSRNTDGNAYAFIERDRLGTPVALWPIDPGTVIVKKNIDDGSIWYEVNDDEHHFLLVSTDLIHVKHISPLTGTLGISPLDVLKGPLTFQKSVQDFSLSEMNKKDSYIIKYDRSISPEKRQAMIQDFVRMIKDNGGAVVQEKGFEYDRFATNFQPSDLSTVESITRSRIATAFNVPLSFLSELEASHSNTTAEQVMTQFVQMTLLPIVKQYEAEFNRKLLTPEQRARGFYFKFNVNGLLRGDTAARTNFYQMMIRNGIASVNDLRKLEELPPSDAKNADQLWLSGDLYPIDSDQIGKGRADTDNPLKGGENEDEQTTEVSDDQATSGQQGS
ncbi:phage portal protein [Limosilactobacillus fermentum]|uniref:phage portal protein n=1 Tax=Limosilactobacillus fermentum TaxID=1613 RepID=UPI003EB8396F